MQGLSRAPFEALVFCSDMPKHLSFVINLPCPGRDFGSVDWQHKGLQKHSFEITRNVRCCGGGDLMAKTNQLKVIETESNASPEIDLQLLRDLAKVEIDGLIADIHTAIAEGISSKALQAAVDAIDARALSLKPMVTEMERCESVVALENGVLARLRGLIDTLVSHEDKARKGEERPCSALVAALVDVPVSVAGERLDGLAAAVAEVGAASERLSTLTGELQRNFDQNKMQSVAEAASEFATLYAAAYDGIQQLLSEASGPEASDAAEAVLETGALEQAEIHRSDEGVAESVELVSPGQSPDELAADAVGVEPEGVAVAEPKAGSGSAREKLRRMWNIEAVSEVVVDAAPAEVEAPAVVSPAPVRAKKKIEHIHLVEPEVEAKLQEPWEETLAGLVASRQTALAWHLARSVVAENKVPAFSAGELRLAAVVGKLNLSTVSVTGMPVEIREALEEVLYLVERDSFGEGAIGNARKLLCFAGALEPALIGRDHAAMTIIERLTIDGEWNKAVFGLKECIRSVGRTGQPLTIELFRGLKEAESTAKDVESHKADIKDAVARIGRLSFSNFNVGTRVASNLASKAQPPGSLALQIDGTAVQAYNAAKDFAKRYSSQENANALVQRVKQETVTAGPDRRTPLIGSVREKLVTEVTDLAASAADYVAACDAAREVEGERRGHYNDLRNQLLQAIDSASKATQAHGDGNMLLRASSDIAQRALDRLRDVIDGTAESSGLMSHLLALHGPTALVPNLYHGRTWLPRGARTADQMAEALSPAIGREIDESLIREAHGSLVVAGAFSSATIVEEFAKDRGYGELVETLCRDSAEAVEPHRSAMGKKLDKARRMLEAIERGGNPSEQEQAVAMAEQLDRIDIARLPVTVAAEVRTEEPEAADSFVDFASVAELVTEIDKRGDAINAKRRELLHAQLTELDAQKIASAEAIQRVRKIVDENDLIIAGEWLEMLRSGVEIQEQREFGDSFRAAFPAVPDFLSSVSPATVVSEMMNAAEAGQDFGPLQFGRIGPGKRAAARDFLFAFQKLRRGVNDGASLPAGGVLRLASEMFGHLGITVSQPLNVKQLVISNSRAVTAQLMLDVPQDEFSNILPDFGSQTGGRWLVMVASQLPTEQEISRFCAAQTFGGTMILVTGLVGTDERRKLALACRQARRKLLVIDLAAVAAVASEPSLRAAYLLEFAQPFSYATPLKDHGKSAVPPESFVGRVREVAAIIDPSGPSVVYGARRNGKTATILHIVDRYHAPADGFIAAAVSVQGCSRLEGGKVADLWPRIAEAMPEVFRAGRVIATPEAFEDGIKRFLAGNPTARIFLMLDEADDVIEADAQADFGAFLTLQNLMEGSGRRFKVVFAGLRNVSRLALEGNAPLRQIASNPIRIGPFAGDELKYAEIMLRKTFAALGIYFSGPEHVWRLVSRANHAPALISVMAGAILQAIYARSMNVKANPPMVIDEAVVNDVLSDPTVMGTVSKTLGIAIEYDRRYVLIANIIAKVVAGRQSEGFFAEGMSIAEISREAALYWPATFGGVSGTSLVEDTLDEMEGLALIRRVGEDHYALKSPSLRNLFGSRDKIETRLDGFINQPSISEFDFRSNRKSVHKTATQDEEPDHLSPLTGGQVGTIFRGRSAIMLASGSDATDIGLFGTALEEHAGSYRGKITRLIEPPKRASDVGVLLGKLSEESGEHLVIFDGGAWSGEHVSAAVVAAHNNKRMTGERPAVRALFVVGPQQVVTISNYPEKLNVDWIAPRQWAEGLVDRAGSKFGAALLGEDRKRFTELTGGLNGLAISAMNAIAGRSDKIAAMNAWADGVSQDELFSQLGIVSAYREHFRKVAVLGDTGEELTLKLLSDLVDVKKPAELVRFARLMGLADQGKDALGETYVKFNPVLERLRG